MKIRPFWTALVAGALPILVAGGLYLPNTPPPVGRMVRDGAVVAVVMGLAGLVLVRRGVGARRASSTLTLAALLALAYPAFSSIFRVERLSWVDQVAGVAYGLVVWRLLRVVVRHSEREALDIHRTLSVVVVALACTVWAWTWHDYARGPRGDWHAVVERLTEVPVLPEAAASDPDVVHILLDGMGRGDVLEQMYGLDSTPYVQRLGRLGVSVEPSAAANYSQTYPSLASFLNMTHLSALTPVLGSQPDRRPYQQLIDRAAVIRAFKKRGYAFTFFGSSFAGARSHPLADRCECDAMPLSEFEMALFAVTPLRSVPTWRLLYHLHRRQVADTFDRLEKLEPGVTPSFVFAHVLVPHPPFLLGPDGPLPTPPREYALLDGWAFQGTRNEYREGYRAQAQYVLERVAHVVERLTTRRRNRPLVVVISGDHGPGLEYDPASVTRTNPRERMSTFLATYWDGRPPPADAPKTLVNIYPTIFNKYLGARLPYKPDTTYLSSFRVPYWFVPVQISELPSAAAR